MIAKSWRQGTILLSKMLVERGTGPSVVFKESAEVLVQFYTV